MKYMDELAKLRDEYRALAVRVHAIGRPRSGPRASERRRFEAWKRLSEFVDGRRGPR